MRRIPVREVAAMRLPMAKRIRAARIGLFLALAAVAAGQAALAQEAWTPIDEAAGRALAEHARAYAEAAWFEGGEGREGIPFLWGGRIDVEAFLAAATAGRAQGLGVDASGVVAGAAAKALPGHRFRRPGEDGWLLAADVTSPVLFEWNVQSIDVGQARPGDLIFFREPESDRIIGVGVVEAVSDGLVHFTVASENAGRVVRTFARIGGDYWNQQVAGLGRLLVRGAQSP